MRGWRKELGSSPSHRQRRPLLPRTNPGCQRAFVPRSLRLGAGGGMKTGPEEHPGGLLCQGLVPSGSPLPSSSRCWPTAGWRSPAEPALGAGSCGAHPAPRSGAWSNALGRGWGVLRFLRSVTRGWDAGPGRGAPPRRRLFCFGCPGIASAQGVRSCCMPALSGTRSRWGGPWGRDPRGTPHAALPYVFEAGAEPAAVPFALAGLEGSDPSPSLKGRAERSEPRPATPSRVGAGGEKRWGGGGAAEGPCASPCPPRERSRCGGRREGKGGGSPPFPSRLPGWPLRRGPGAGPWARRSRNPSFSPQNRSFTAQPGAARSCGGARSWGAPGGAGVQRTPPTPPPPRGWRSRGGGGGTKSS